MLETALVLVPLLALILGILDFSVAIFLQTAFRHAVREGVRYAITGKTQSGMGQDASVKAVVQQSAIGFLSGTSGADKIHIRYYDPVTLTEVSSNAGGNLVEVSVEGYRYYWMAPIMGNTGSLSLTARSSDVVEPSPNGTPPTR
jgi:Flp pilus assembly protein TadG